MQVHAGGRCFYILFSMSFCLSVCTFSFWKEASLNPIQFLAAWGSFKAALCGQTRRSSHPPPGCLREQKHSGAVKHTDPPQRQQRDCCLAKYPLLLLCSHSLTRLSLLTSHSWHPPPLPPIDLIKTRYSSLKTPSSPIFCNRVAPSLYNLSFIPSLTLAASVSYFTLSNSLSHHLPLPITSYLSCSHSSPGTPSLCPAPPLYFCCNSNLIPPLTPHFRCRVTDAKHRLSAITPAAHAGTSHAEPRGDAITSERELKWRVAVEGWQYPPMSERR